MTRQKKPAGGPKTTGKGTLIGIRFHDPDLEDLDAWCLREGTSVATSAPGKEAKRSVLAGDR